MRTNKLLVAVVVVQGLLLLGQWAGQSVTVAKPAYETNLPDPGARQLAMLEELRNLNAKMDKLTSTLQSGEMQVRVKAEK